MCQNSYGSLLILKLVSHDVSVYGYYRSLFDIVCPMTRVVLPTVRSSIQETIPLAVPTAVGGTTYGMDDHSATCKVKKMYMYFIDEIEYYQNIP